VANLRSVDKVLRLREYPPCAVSGDDHMNLSQQVENCSDFDVVLDGETSPAFRVLLPERIDTATQSHSGTHTIPGVWQERANGTDGHFSIEDAWDVGVSVDTCGSEVRVDITIRNTGREEARDVWLDICTSLNRLPGEPNWCNERFLPRLPLDRSVQGRYWFEQASPGRLHALTPRGWVEMHPCPDQPDADRVPVYSFVPSETADAWASAVESADGKAHFYQTWSAACRYCTPCPGNACMHLEPFVAEALRPSESASLRGLVGMHQGCRDSLVEKIARFREEG